MVRKVITILVAEEFNKNILMIRDLKMFEHFPLFIHQMIL